MELDKPEVKIPGDVVPKVFFPQLLEIFEIICFFEQKFQKSFKKPKSLEFFFFGFFIDNKISIENELNFCLKEKNSKYPFSLQFHYGNF